MLAFNNGQGDEFYAKDGQYVAMSRKDDCYEAMLKDGFALMSYSDVRRIAAEQAPPAPATIDRTVRVINAPVRMVNNSQYFERDSDLPDLQANYYSGL